MQKLKLITLLILGITFLPSYGQKKVVSALLDSTNMRIGQQLVLHLSATFPAQDTLFWPSFTDTLGKLEIVSQSRIDTSYDPNNITTKLMRQNIVLTSFDSGYFPIPPIFFHFKDTILKSDPLLIEVKSVAVDTSKGIYDIREPYEVPFNFLSWVKSNKHWIIGGAVILAIVIGLFIWLKNRKITEQTIVQPKKPKIPAHKVALKKLKDVEHQKLWQHNKTKTYYSSVSEIIREYLELRYGMIALEQTTPEIIEASQAMDITAEQQEKLYQILSLADLVKFAKSVPVASENELTLANAFAFVETTKTIDTKNGG